MGIIGEFFIELIFQRIIVRFFGYYTLIAFYKLTNNKDELKWLNEASKHEGEAFGKGCLISMSNFIKLCQIYYLTANLTGDGKREV